MSTAFSRCLFVVMSSFKISYMSGLIVIVVVSNIKKY